jgi:hypothetical protein
MAWDDIRKPYQDIIRNLINNINICNKEYVKTGDEGYMVMREKYIKEVEKIKTMITEKESKWET